MKDTAHAIIAAELDPEFNKMCEEIKEARRKRGMFNYSYPKTTYIEALYRQIGMASCSQALDLVDPVFIEGTTQRGRSNSGF